MSILIYNYKMMDTEMFRKTAGQLIGVILLLISLAVSSKYEQFEPKTECNIKAGASLSESGMNDYLSSLNLSVSDVISKNTVVDHEKLLPELIYPIMIDENSDLKSEHLLDSASLADVNKAANTDVSLELPIVSQEGTIAEPVESTIVPDQTEEPAIIPEETDEEINDLAPEEPVTYVTETGFEYNENGMIVSCAGYMNFDGVLVLPSDNACRGITAAAIADIPGEIFEVYIPSNIVEIEQGAFNCLTDLWYVEVQSGNPVYMSIEGELYYLNGTKF